jgi:hypothetical protein
MDKLPSGREDYVRKVLEAYHSTPGTTAICAGQTACWPSNSINAAYH